MEQQTPQQQIEQEAWAWIAKLSDQPQPAPEDIQQLHRWMAQSDDHYLTFKRLSQTWDDMDILSALAIPRRQRQGVGRLITSGLVWLLSPLLMLWLALQKAVTYGQTSPARFALASFPAAGAIGLVVWLNLPLTTAVYITGIGQQSSHTLPDGSVLTLNTNSKVSIDYQQHQRQITLHTGEAHFDVKPDKSRPFEVYAGTRMVRAIGTAFSVFLDNQQVEVTVAEGKVALAVQSDTAKNHNSPAEVDTRDVASANTATVQHEVLGNLVAGQSVVIPAGPKGAMDTITDHEKQALKRRLSWLEGQLIYAGEGLDKVVSDISRYTPIYIELTDPGLKTLRIGGQFKVGETEALFRVLEVGFGLTVTRLSEYHVQISRAE